VSNAAVDALVREILRRAPSGEPEELARRLRRLKRRAKASQTPYTIAGDIGAIAISSGGGRLSVDSDDPDPETDVDVEVSLDDLGRVAPAWLAR
jgi:hypothetical protein